MKREVRLFDELTASLEAARLPTRWRSPSGTTATPPRSESGRRSSRSTACAIRWSSLMVSSTRAPRLACTVLRGRRHAGAFHPKLFLAVREDAVFAAVGSANLTRGGLGANLELLTPLVFAKDAERPPPRALLQSILAFVDRVAADLAGRIVEGSREKILEVLEHARLAIEGLPEPRRGPDLRFLHSYDEPLLNQLATLHGDDPVTHLAVVSPFFEVDDPELDESDLAPSVRPERGPPLDAAGEVPALHPPRDRARHRDAAPALGPGRAREPRWNSTPRLSASSPGTCMPN